MGPKVKKPDPLPPPPEPVEPEDDDEELAKQRKSIMARRSNRQSLRIDAPGGTTPTTTGLSIPLA